MAFDARAWMRRPLILAAAVTTFAAALAGSAGAARSTVIEVFPGANAIQSALQGANAGDTLNVHAGTYPETVNVSVANVTIQAAGDGPVTVDGTCDGSTFDVSEDGVTIRGLQVIGGGFFNIDYRVVSGGQILGNRIKSTCPDAEYGINLFNTGAMLLEGNQASGFRDAGIYIGSIVNTGTGTLVARRNEVFRNFHGIIVEDSADVSIVVRNNFAHDNFDDGVFLHNADGILVQRNTVSDNGPAGIELDASSDNNLVGSNRVRGHTFDLINGGGTGNCFQNNVYTTSFGSITC